MFLGFVLGSVFLWLGKRFACHFACILGVIFHVLSICAKHAGTCEYTAPANQIKGRAPRKTTKKPSKINRNNNVRIIRDGIVIYTGALGSLKRFKDDVKEVANNYECGLNIDKYNDIKVGDVVEAFEEVEVAKKL